MKINKRQIEMLTSLPDDALRHMINTIASSAGFDLSGINMSGDNINKLRTVLRDMNEEDISRAAEVLKNLNKN